MTRVSWRLAAPGLALALGCAGVGAVPDSPDAPPVTRGQAAEAVPRPLPLGVRPAAPRPAGPVVPTGFVEPTTTLPPPTAQAPAPPEQPVPVDPASPVRPVLPVSLDAVLRLAEGQNPQLAVARERVKQAYAEQDLADRSWLPEVHVGAGYYRHEGGIQDQDGRLIRSSTGAVLAGLDLAARLDLRAAAFSQLDAARRALQQKGELRKLTSEVVLDAASTYIDLLAAHSGLAIARALEADLRSLRDRAQRLASLERGARIQVVQIDAEITGQEQVVRKLEGQAAAASAKLAYLLGLDPCTELVPVDAQLVALALADADLPVCELVNRALACGPGVRELEKILALIQTGMAEAAGPQRFLPVFTAQALEGGFGAGPNSDLTFANRFDLGVQARWNVTELLTADAQKRIGASALAQAQYTYADVRGKLALGVKEARASVLSGREQLRLAGAQIEQARQALELSDLRLREGIAGASFSEVLLAQRAVAGARANYLAVLRDYDKAQLRLMVLTGCGCPAPAAPRQ
jgi:outer membrane protein TolC